MVAPRCATRAGEANPLECNLDALRGLSFAKGCYVGQEGVARVHARGVVRKRLMPFKLGAARGSGCISAGEARHPHLFLSTYYTSNTYPGSGAKGPPHRAMRPSLRLHLRLRLLPRAAQ